MPTFENIPAELQALPQWLLWRYAVVDGKTTKLPVNPKTLQLGSAAHAPSWGNFADCVELCRLSSSGDVGGHRLAGIGFVFTPSDPYCGIDLDAPPDEATAADHAALVALLDSYTERSPSGKGLHVIVRGKMPDGGRRAYGVEAYSEGRYFTFTGDVVADKPIAERQGILDELAKELGANNRRQRHTLIRSQPATESDAAVVARIMGAANGDKARRLAAGDASVLQGNGDTSGSAIDLALVNIIQFYTSNVDQIERVWLSTPHGASRADKLARVDYRRRTIGLAFDRDPPVIDTSELQKKWAAESSSSLREETAGATDTRGPAAKGSDRGGVAVAPADGYMPTVGDGVNGAPQAPPGLLGELAAYIYSQAPRPVPEIALAGAIGWMAGVAGRAYNVSGVGLNLYIAMIASSGSGKEAISTGYSKIRNALRERGVESIDHFFTPSDFTSVPSLLRSVYDKPSSVSLITEFGHWLSQMSGNMTNPIRRALNGTLLALYTKSGKGNVMWETAYADKANDIKQIVSPALTLLGETTPSTFYTNVTDKTIQDGFLPRFLLIEYKGDAPYINYGARDVGVPTSLVDRLAQFVEHCLMLNGPVIENKGGAGQGVLLTQVGPLDVSMTADVEHAWKQLDRNCTDRVNATENESERTLWTRVGLNAIKLAALIAVGENAHTPVIGMPAWVWAERLVLGSMTSLLAKMDTGEVAGTDEDMQWETFMAQLRRLPTLGTSALNGYKMTPYMAQNWIVSNGWFATCVGKQAPFRRDRMGQALALKRVVARALAEDLMAPIDKRDAAYVGKPIMGNCYLIDWRKLS